MTREQSSKPTADRSDAAPSKGRRAGRSGDFDYFFTGNYFDERGWRENSPSRLYQAFGKVGWQTDKSDVDLSYTYADTSLYGNGAVPVSLLDYDYEASYTPDYTANLLSFANLTGTQFLSEKLLLSGNVYYRHLVTDAVNGNVNDSYLSSYAGPPLDCTAPRGASALRSPIARRPERGLAAGADHEGDGLQLTDSAGPLRLE